MWKVWYGGGGKEGRGGGRERGWEGRGGGRERGEGVGVEVEEEEGRGGACGEKMENTCRGGGGK